MHFHIKKKTKTTKKEVTNKADPDAQTPVEVRPVTVPAESPEEWVTLPQAGDCIALRVDNEASTNHLPTQAEIQLINKQPTETQRYLAIVTGVSLDSVLRPPGRLT